jgi:putative flippase GtrA
MLARQVLRFAVTGVGATAVHVCVVYVLVLGVALSYAGANLVASVTAAVFSYVVNALWSFEQRVRASNAWRFTAVSAVSALLASAIGGVAEASGWTPSAAIAAVVAIVTPLTFLMHRTWTFATAPHLRHPREGGDPR